MEWKSMTREQKEQWLTRVIEELRRTRALTERLEGAFIAWRLTVQRAPHGKK